MQQELTRREALKRGALLAGGLAWATPVVQAVGMSPAYAQVPSPGEEVDCCIGPDGKTTKLGSLTMEYLGEENFCGESDFTQDDGLVSCTDFLDPLVDSLPDQVYLVASAQESIFLGDGTYPKPGTPIWFEGTVSKNSTFVIDALEGLETRLRGETWVHIFMLSPDGDPDPDAYLQKLAFHTSCSEPLLTGDQFGSVLLVGCTPEDPDAVIETEQAEGESLETEEVGEETPVDETTEQEVPEGEEESDSTPGNKPPETPGEGPKTDAGNDGESETEVEPVDG